MRFCACALCIYSADGKTSYKRCFKYCSARIYDRVACNPGICLKINSLFWGLVNWISIRWWNGRIFTNNENLRSIKANRTVWNCIETLSSSLHVCIIQNTGNKIVFYLLFAKVWKLLCWLDVIIFFSAFLHIPVSKLWVLLGAVHQAIEFKWISIILQMRLLRQVE